MEIQREHFDSLAENHLPDGSRLLIDHKNETVYALNATAGAAWDACSAPTSLHDVTKQMQTSFGSEVTPDFAEEAILQLQKQNLVTAPMGARQTTRREVLTKFGKAALPIVVAMTLTEQTEHAAYASSGQSNPPTSNPPGGSKPCNIILKIFGLC
ncbi:MAG TPA: PqqD family protein [Terracidiphilus sp.]|nr:PqqD family protein [Terracidiphilus sp.]